MPINETILKNRKYRHCIDSTPGNKRWNRYSFWTHASDVEFNDGRNLQDKLGSFKGVTTNENQTAGYAADVTLVKSVKNSLSQLITSLTNLVNSINTRLGGLRFYEDSNGKWVVGADSVPKKLGSGGLGSEELIVSDLLYQTEKEITIPGQLVQDPSTGNWHEEGAIYGNMAIYDLSFLPDYRNFVFGENIICTIGTYRAGQVYNGYRVGLLFNKKIQRNIDSLDNNVNINSFNGSGKYAPSFDADDYIYVNNNNTLEKVNLDASNYIRYSNCALYVPSTGKLHVVTNGTGQSILISLYKI